HLFVFRRAIDDGGIFDLADRLPAPHLRAGAGAVRGALQAADRDPVDGLAERLAPGRRGLPRKIGAGVAEAAVAVARTAVVAEREPVEVEIISPRGRGAAPDRAVDRVASGNRTVRAGIVIVHVA